MEEHKKIKEFKKLEEEVRAILKSNEQARADDHKLYCDYVYTILTRTQHLAGEGWLVRVMSDTRYRVIHGIAPYESVSRVRRRLQAKDKSLRPSEEVLEARKQLIREYKAYAKGVKV